MGRIVYEREIIMLGCEARCHLPHLVTLYVDQQVSFYWNERGTQTHIIDNWSNGRGYYCAVDDRPDANSTTTVFTVHCEY